MKPDNIMDCSESSYRAMDTKGLSLCGLTICKKDNNYIEEAMQTYKKARTINKDKGYVKRILRLFDKLTKADTDGLLKDVRTTIQ
ncbi:MAG: hypothetical protein GY774_01255 [Planctomycetes bacterium]|nr:hypothetical protein [Planctomycetota bacterium]